MAIPDPLQTGIVVASTLQAAKQVQDFIAATHWRPQGYHSHSTEIIVNPTRILTGFLL